MQEDEELDDFLDRLMKTVLDRFPDDQTILRADTGQLEEDVYHAVIFLAHIETRDPQALADAHDKTLREMQVDLFNAKNKTQEDGAFRSIVQSAGVYAGIDTKKMMDEFNNPPEEFTPH